MSAISAPVANNAGKLRKATWGGAWAPLRRAGSGALSRRESSDGAALQGQDGRDISGGGEMSINGKQCDGGQA